jgi:hypothetical protein
MSSERLETSQPRRFDGPCTTEGCEKLATYTLTTPDPQRFRRSCPTCGEEILSTQQMDQANVDYW